MQEKNNDHKQIAEKVYEVPSVIYEGYITTRAGSPVGNPNTNDGVDPADLFGTE